MFTSSSISSSVELWFVNHTLIYQNSEVKLFKNIKYFGQISNNLPNDLLETNVYKNLVYNLESCW